MKICPVILSGGSGTRLWPLSRRLLPKQFLKLSSEKSLIVETANRINSSTLDTLPPLIVCSEDHKFLISNQLNEEKIEYLKIILEPVGKNTAPAASLAACYLKERYPNEELLILIMPADHKIGDNDGFINSINGAINYASNSLFIFGIEPNSPSTSYGYIEADGKENASENKIHEVLGFHEKPGLEKSTEYFNSPNFYWNSGIFLFSVTHFLESLLKTDREIIETCKKAIQHSTEDGYFIEPNKEIFETCPSNSIDYSLMERALSNSISVKMMPLGSSWNDLGTWKSLFESKEKDSDGNVLEGDTLVKNTTGSYINSNDGMIAVTGLQDTIVVKTDDVVFVSPISGSEDVEILVQELKERGREEVDLHKEVHRPWGTYRSIAEAGSFKVKRIKVHPGAKLSLQLHHSRSEHWVVVEGEASVTKGEEEITLGVNESVFIEKEEKHSLANKTNNSLEIIEVQIGDYLGEDDIVRFEDKYGRIDN